MCFTGGSAARTHPVEVRRDHAQVCLRRQDRACFFLDCWRHHGLDKRRHNRFRNVCIDGAVGTTGLEIRERLEGRAGIEQMILPEADRKDARKRDSRTVLDQLTGTPVNDQLDREEFDVRINQLGRS